MHHHCEAGILLVCECTFERGVEVGAVREAREPIVQGLVAQGVHLTLQAVRYSLQQREECDPEAEEDEIEHDHDRDDRVLGGGRDRSVVARQHEDPHRAARRKRRVRAEHVAVGLIEDRACGGAAERRAHERGLAVRGSDKGSVAAVRDPPSCVENLDAKSSASDRPSRDLPVEDETARARDGCLQILRGHTVAKGICHQPRLQGRRLLRLRALDVDEDEENGGAREREPDRGIRGESENEPGRRSEVHRRYGDARPPSIAATVDHGVFPLPLPLPFALPLLHWPGLVPVCPGAPTPPRPGF